MKCDHSYYLRLRIHWLIDMPECLLWSQAEALEVMGCLWMLEHLAPLVHHFYERLFALQNNTLRGALFLLAQTKSQMEKLLCHILNTVFYFSY